MKPVYQKKWKILSEAKNGLRMSVIVLSGAETKEHKGQVCDNEPDSG